MAIECEAIIPEVEVRFPAVMENRTLESRTLIINEDIGIDDRKGVIDLRKHNFLFDPCPPGSKFVIRLTAEDGTEYPRVEENSFMSCNWLCLDTSSENRSIGVQVKGVDRNLGIYSDGINCAPLPTGTVTTITFCDGQWTCDIVEPPKDWLPIDFGLGLRLERGVHNTVVVRCHSCPIGINPKTMRELADALLHAADEIEFPGDTFPRRHNSDRSVQFDERTGHLWFGNHCQVMHSCITTEEEGDFMIRAIRQWKRLRKEASK